MRYSTRRSFFKRTGLYVLALPFLNLRKFVLAKVVSDAGMVYFTNGLKISELQPDRAIIWTRLCAGMNPVPVTHDRIDKGGTDYPVDFDEEMPVNQMDGAVPGTTGAVRLILEGQSGKITTEWHKATPDTDYTVQIQVNGLTPATSYSPTLEGRKNCQTSTNRNQEDVRPEHRFLRVNGGFLTVGVDRQNKRPYIRFTHYDVDGNPMHSERFEGEDRSE